MHSPCQVLRAKRKWHVLVESAYVVLQVEIAWPLTGRHESQVSTGIRSGVIQQRPIEDWEGERFLEESTVFAQLAPELEEASRCSGQMTVH